ncbi:TolC family protein [Dyella solisilvae]|uniref:TolC family protein n=2 Tax=Dyella solisilvae TaxID=1920168 RepID=A0A370K9R8_9GAMM|nr:TolC family protein [Dyella solisilvae]
MSRRALLCGLLLLSGCNLAPRYEPPPVAMADQFPSPETHGARAPELPWQDFFHDPVLRDLIGKALDNNRDLAAAAARIEQARAQFRIQQSQRLPSVNLGGSADRLRAAVSPAEDAPRVTVDSYAVQVGIPAFELDFWGRVANLSESARRQYLSTVEAERAFRLSLIANVAASYYAMRSAEEGIVLAQKSLDSRRETMELAQLRMDVGFTSSIDYNQSYTLVTQAETQLAQLKRGREQTLHLLQQFVGVPLPDPLPPSLPLEDTTQIAPLAPGLPSDLLNDRPDVRAAEERLRAANANIGAARALYFPTIALTGAAGYASDELSNLFSGPNHLWTFGVGATLPLLDWGRRRSQVELAQGQRNELEATYQSTVQNAFREVADGLSATQHNAEQIQAQIRTVEAQAALVTTAEDRYGVGLTPYLEVLDAERNHFAAEQTLLQLRASDLQDRVNLYAALGGGDLPPPQKTVASHDR